MFQPLSLSQDAHSAKRKQKKKENWAKIQLLATLTGEERERAIEARRVEKTKNRGESIRVP